MEVQGLFRKISAFALKKRVRPLLALVAVQGTSAALGVRRVSPPALGLPLTLPGSPRGPADLPLLVPVFPVGLCHCH